MPAFSGSSGADRTKRTKSASQKSKKILGRQKILSREKALNRVHQFLLEDNLNDPELIELISLFQLQMDELTEAGIAYELVRALEKRHPLLLMK